MKKILQSKVIKEAFSILYESKLKYPFNNEKEASNFVDNYVEFIYLKDSSGKGASNKFTCKIYIFIMKRKINISNNINKTILFDALYSSAYIKVFLHELNHDFYNYYYFQSNGKIPLSTPRKKNIKEREGGKYFEFLLFQQKLKKINLVQALYLLNENNYNKTLYEFSQGFLKPSPQDLNIVGEFSNLNEEIQKLKNNNENLEDIFIKTDEDEFNSDDYEIDVDIDDDILGFPRS